MSPLDAALQCAPRVLSHFHMILIIPDSMTLTSVKGYPCSLSHEQLSSTPASSLQRYLSWFLLFTQYYFYFCIDNCTTGKILVLSWSEEAALEDMRCPCQWSSRHCHCQLLQLFLLASQHRFHPVWFKPPPSRASSGGHAMEMHAIDLLRTLTAAGLVTPNPTLTGKGGLAIGNNVKIYALYTLLTRLWLPLHRGQSAHPAVT